MGKQGARGMESMISVQLSETWNLELETLLRLKKRKYESCSSWIGTYWGIDGN